MISEEESSPYQEEKKFVSCPYASKEEFIRRYGEEYGRKERAKQLYLLILTEIEEAMSLGNVDRLKKLDQFIDFISDVEDKLTLGSYFDDPSNPLKSINLVILACRHNKLKILEFLLENDCKIHKNLSIGIKASSLLPQDEDENCHNAFYYAIRSGNSELLDTLIEKWPGNYFATRLEELDSILSQAYEELKLKNVPLTEEMELFVENKLINLRFFSNTSGSDPNVKSDFFKVSERIQLLLENISLLKTEYGNTKKVDEKFLLIAKFLAHNIYILKRQLRSTYDRLPWEEIEFCLVAFVSSHIKQQEINLFYNATFSKSKILTYLEHFAKKLKEIMDNINGENIGKFDVFPNSKRDNIIRGIIKVSPEFDELYTDYHLARDIHTLEKISDYIKLALSADPNKKEGQLIITRVLQVIGEYLKNTLESPKLSTTTSDLLLLSLPKNTRQIVIDLRNSLSHAYSLSKRTEIEENTDANFFIGVQNDTKRISNVITDILYKYKIKMVRDLLEKIRKSESPEEIKEVAEILANINLDEKIKESFNDTEHNKLEKPIMQLSDVLPEKTDHIKQLLYKIKNIINIEKNKSTNVKTNHDLMFTSLIHFGFLLNDNIIDQNLMIEIKNCANKVLENIPSQMDSHNLKQVVELLLIVSHSSLRLAVKKYQSYEILRLTYEIFVIAAISIGNLKWIEELREKLKAEDMFISTYKRKKAYNITEEKYNDQLELKLSELKSIFKDNALNDTSVGNLASYKKNKMLQAVVEMLILDIMSILGITERYVENNLHFLDDNLPLLTGKCLRNHLAHDNALVSLLLTDPSIAVILNAKKLVSENLIKSNKKVGKLVMDDPSKLKDKYSQSLITITNQEKMFVALEEGNLEELKSCLRKGIDIYTRSINFSTTLHFAAKGPSLQIIKFILAQGLDANVKDFNGQSPLHIAAAHGRTNTVEFFIREVGVCIDIEDKFGKTPLHLAAKNGHKDTVETLLKYNSNFNAKDKPGYSPLHYAVKNNHIDVAKILLRKEENVDINEAFGGYTSLHFAAENGHLELVNYLINNGTNVNASNFKGGSPLHAAARNGHLEVVTELILNGAKVNTSVIDGFTPLYYAVETGRDEVVNILLKNGAKADIVERTYKCTPLHVAAKNGYLNIVKALLEANANPSTPTVEGLTPIHFAAMSGHLEIVSTLLDHGANAKAKAVNNDSSLHYAAENGNRHVAELLIKSGAEVNAKGNHNVTPLHIAALKGQKEVIAILINHKANVGAKDISGRTPLHEAAGNGHVDTVQLLLKNNAGIDTKDKDGMTPLHLAAQSGNLDVTAFLIKRQANVYATNKYGHTPLCSAVTTGQKDIVNLLLKFDSKVKENLRKPLKLAVEEGHKEIVEILIANGVNVNGKMKNTMLLGSAILGHHKEIVEILIKNGANVNAENGTPLLVAVFAGFGDIVEILVKNNADVNTKDSQGDTPLHIAAKREFPGIVNTLIANGAKVDAVSVNNVTPLFNAVLGGHDEIAEILIANKANVNIFTVAGAPIHAAAAFGYLNLIEILVSNGAKVDIKDPKDKTPLEIAVAYGHLPVVKYFVENKLVDLNAKYKDDYTILHIAAEAKSLEMVKYLVSKGCNIRAKNVSGRMPIHGAARDGFKDNVEFFLSKGINANVQGAAKQTLLHYASINGHVDIVKYVIANGGDVNAVDINGSSPMHIAAYLGQVAVIKTLMKNGAFYDIVDNQFKKPSDMTKDKVVKKLLALTDKLFMSVKLNSASEVENDIKAGALVNAINCEGITPLHFAVWKGYEKVVTILLRHEADPNSVGKKRCTPLHYAAKFSHLKIVKALLAQGAIYNALSNGGKTPSDFATNSDITNLFKLISDSFENVKKGNSKVIDDLNSMPDIDTVRAVMCARNRENKTLVATALLSNFSKVEKLKQISHSDVSAQVDSALELAAQGNYERALSILRMAFEKRKQVLGPDNPATLDIQTHIATVLYKHGVYQESLDMLQEISEKQTEILGLNNKDTLKTRSMIALVLHRQGKNSKAFDIYQEVYEKQKEILEPNHPDILTTQFHWALVLNELERYEESLKINKEVFERRKNTLGLLDPTTVCALNNIAFVLNKLGRYEESLEIYKEVFETKKVIYGINHTDTLRTLNSIAGIFFSQKKYNKALKAFQEVLALQKKVLLQNHPETLSTQYNIGNVLFTQGKFTSALKVFRECHDLLKATFGPNDRAVLDISEKIRTINLALTIEGSQESHVLEHLEHEIINAVCKGNLQTVERLLKDGSDPNEKDVNGRTLLHFAVSNGRIDIVKILLENGADVCLVTNKGNTPLHTAASKSYKEISEILLQHISRDKLNNFINAKTTVSGSSALHIAAKEGSLPVVKCLLKYGAAYKIENKEGEIPMQLSTDEKVIELLNLVNEFFKYVQHGNIHAISLLRRLKRDEILSITNARDGNNNGKTLLQVAIANGYKNVATKLLQILK